MARPRRPRRLRYDFGADQPRGVRVPIREPGAAGAVHLRAARIIFCGGFMSSPIQSLQRTAMPMRRCLRNRRNLTRCWSASVSGLPRAADDSAGGCADNRQGRGNRKFTAKGSLFAHFQAGRGGDPSPPLKGTGTHLNHKRGHAGVPRTHTVPTLPTGGQGARCGVPVRLAVRSGCGTSPRFWGIVGTFAEELDVDPRTGRPGARCARPESI